MTTRAKPRPENPGSLAETKSPGVLCGLTLLLCNTAAIAFVVGDRNTC
jgi:hypothetical protein